jgi:hypothetical protein
MDFSLYQQPSWHVTAARNFTKHIFVNKAFVCDETKKVHSFGTAIFRQNVECQIRRLLSEVLNRRKMCLINVVLWLLAISAPSIFIFSALFSSIKHLQKYKPIRVDLIVHLTLGIPSFPDMCRHARKTPLDNCTQKSA